MTVALAPVREAKHSINTGWLMNVSSSRVLYLIACVSITASLSSVLYPDEAAAQQPPPPTPEADQVDQAPGPANAGWDGDFFLESDDGRFRLELGGRLQTQYRTRSDEDGDERDLESAFLIRRSRLSLSGHALAPELTFKFQADFGGGDVDLLDHYLNYAFAPDTVEGRLGKWRLPFLRQEIASSGKLLLVNRSLITRVFGEGFDIGAGIHNNFKAAPNFEWVVGIFNGTQSALGAVSVDDPLRPTVFFPTVVARVAYNYGGIDPYREGDLEGGPLRFSVGASGLTQFGLEREDESAMKATADYVVKVAGFSTSGAVVLATGQDGSGLLDQETLATGLYAQAGYAIADLIQPTVRYSHIDRDDDEITVHEALGGLNVYFYEHNLKWQTDAGAVVREVPNDTETTYRLRTQLQLEY